MDFLNEYIKRYRSFIDAALYLNDKFENFNVLINYLYENLSPNENNDNLPKFSILRLMLGIWDKEVLSKLFDSIKAKTVNQYKALLINTLNINGSFKMMEDSNFLRSSLQSTSTNLSEYNNKNKEIDNNSNDVNKCNTLIQEVAKSFVDFSINEYSVFMLNSSTINLENSYYESFEMELIYQIKDVFGKCSNLKENEISHIQNNSILFNFIQRTREKIINMITDSLIEENFNEVKEYILAEKKEDKVLSNKDIGNYFQAFGDHLELKHEEEIFNRLYKNGDDQFMKYKIINSIRELTKHKNKYLFNYAEAFNWRCAEESAQETVNVIINKENEKRNIINCLENINNELYQITFNNKFTIIKEEFKAKDSLMLENERSNTFFNNSSFIELIKI